MKSGARRPFDGIPCLFLLRTSDENGRGNHGRKICWQKNESGQASASLREFQTAAMS
jgi:hypothetical protein